jgi:hypothetical protein
LRRSKAEVILEQMTVVLHTDTDAIVLWRVGPTERRACLMRAGAGEAWVVRLDFSDLAVRRLPTSPERGSPDSVERRPITKQPRPERCRQQAARSTETQERQGPCCRAGRSG